MQSTPPTRSWEVLIIGGASGAGKTSLSYRLAHYFGTGITEADDIHQALLAMTTPEQDPLLHYWHTHPKTRQWTPERIVEHFIQLCQHLNPAFEAVIANHLETNIPLILEGDYLLPTLAVQTAFQAIPNTGRVRGILIHEEDEEQFIRNYLAREPASGRQERRARVSWLHSQWLVEQVHKHGGTVIAARPWQTSFDRILAALT